MPRAIQPATHSRDGSIGIDARSLRRGPAGIATYVSNLLEHLPELSPLDTQRPGNNVIWNQTVVPWATLRRRWRLYHAPGYTGPLLLPRPLVVTAPDVSYLVDPAFYPHRMGWARRSYYRASLLAADRIIVTSQFSRNELARVLPRVAPKVRCTYLAASPSFRKDTRKATTVVKKYRLPETFLLHVGDLHRRRNIPLLKKASGRLKLPLVLVGRLLEPEESGDPGPWHFQDLPWEDLVGFYSAARVFVYASLYEGFGLPLLEALACDLPVVAVRRSCVPEVCGEAAVLVEPEIDDFVAGIEEALGRTPELVGRGRQRAGKFSWATTAEATRAVYRELL